MTTAATAEAPAATPATAPVESRRVLREAQVRATRAARTAQARAGFTAVVPPPTAPSEVAALKEMIAVLQAQVTALATARPNTAIPRTKGPEGNIQEYLKGLPPGQERSGIRKVQDLMNPRATEDGFQPNDIVAVLPTSQKYAAWAKVLRIGPDELILGQVLQYVGTLKTAENKGVRKYKVHFKGIGKDGVTEQEIELVQAA